MRFSALVTLLPLLLSTSSVFAINRDVIRARQAHVKKDLLDVCVALDVDVNIAPAGVKILAGHVNLCLCLSVLPGFLNSNSVARNVVNHLGVDGARDYFSNLIQSQKSKQQCHYPPHGIPFCSIQRPCDFQCSDGYTPWPPSNPTQCVCKAPNTECNGVCGNFPRGCGSQGPTLKRSQPTCAAGKTMCGVPNSESGVDCVDTFSNAESCGGCAAASPFGNNVADGTNCRNIPNVKDVRCNGGACQVISCKEGFNPSKDGGACVRPRLNRVRKARDVAVVDDCFDRLKSHHLLVNGFDIVAAKALILATIDILDYHHVLQSLILQGAVVYIEDVLVLADVLGINLTLLGRDNAPYNTDLVLGTLLDKGLIAGQYRNVPDLKAFLGVAIVQLDLDRLLAYLIAQGLIVEFTDVLKLKELLGVWIGIL